MSTMRFINEPAQTKYFAACQDKCKYTVQIKNEDGTTLCTGKYVNCSENGGYDPTDPCNQTCIQKKEDVLKETPRDTIRSELTLETTSIIKFGEKLAVKCLEFDAEIQCFDEIHPDKML